MKLTQYFDFSAQAAPDYFRSIFEQRSIYSPLRAGSYYNATPEQICCALRNADWLVDDKVVVSEGKICFKTQLEGIFGMYRTEKIPPNFPIMVIKPKPTDKFVSLGVKASVQPKIVKTTRMIVSINPDRTGFILTVFPGRDIAPNLVYTDQLQEGQVITRAQALKLGLTYTKLL